MPIMMGLALGAAVGGGMAALQNKDILQGALIGGATGAITGGIGAGFGGTAGTIAEGAGSGGIGALIGEGGAAAGVNAFESALPGMAGEMGGIGAMAPMTGAATSPLGLAGAYDQALTGAGANAGQAVASSPVTGLPGTTGFEAFKADPLKYLSANKMPLAGAGLAGSMLAGNQSQSSGAGQENQGQIRPYTFNRAQNTAYAGAGTPYFNQYYNAGTPYAAANGGVVGMAEGGETSGIAALQPEMQAQFIAPAQRYSQNVRTPNADVQQYNQMLADRARAEYITATQPAAFTPRPTPVAPVTPAAPSGTTTGIGTTYNPATQTYTAAPKPAVAANGVTPTPGGAQTAGISGLTPYELSQQVFTAQNPPTETQVQQQIQDSLNQQAQTGQPSIFEGYTYVPGQGLVDNRALPAAQQYTPPPITEAVVQQQVQQAQSQPGNPFEGYTYVPNQGLVENRALPPSQVYVPPATNTTPYGERSLQDIMNLQQQGLWDNSSGGAKNGGLMRSYAMGGNIGTRYPAPDDGDMIGAHQTMNMAPQYPMQGTATNYASGGISHLGDYSDGGRLLKGPGDGVSDDIPAQIGAKQPARLANNEFVVPARVVSEIGNGSTDAGAKRLYEMMDRVQKRRSKTTGKGNIAVDSGAHKELNRL